MRGVALLLFLPACGGSPFSVAFAPADVGSEGGTGGTATQPIELAMAAPDAGSPEASPDAGSAQAEAQPEAGTLGASFDASSDASPNVSPSPPEASTPEASPDVLPRPIDVLCHLSIGNVGCPGAGIWTVYYGGGESCDANRAPTTGCPVGAPCQATNTPGGTVYQGTCE